MPISPEELASMAKAFLSKKEEVLQALLKDLDKCETIAAGCGRVLEDWDKVKDNPENAEKILMTSLKSTRTLCEINRRLLMVLMVYSMGDQFNSDAANLLIKLGHGKEAVHLMFKAKLRGK